MCNGQTFCVRPCPSCERRMRKRSQAILRKQAQALTRLMRTRP